MKTEKIVVVGGGSAGWMSASFLIKAFPNKEIVVVESPNVPRVGVGESTYDGIQKFIQFLEIDKDDFFKHTDASIKLAIKFSNFYNNTGDNDFIYPFGAPNTEGTVWGLDDWHIKRFINKETDNTTYAESYFPAASLVKNNTYTDNKNNELPGFISDRDTALHFDAIKFADWLKNNYALPRGVTLLQEDVVGAKVSESGIDSLKLSSGENISADLFIDCTGFKSLLLGEYLQETFVSYNDVLPNNRAWATQIDYTNKDVELDAVTTCTAIESGWVWNIPLWSRIGTGYVYSDKYSSPEDALKDFKNYLIKTKGRKKKEIDSLDFKDIKMRVGIHERTWVKNVVAIGLAAGFIEPLESNGLFTVHEFLFQLGTTISREETTRWDVDVYNYEAKKLYDDFVSFIRMHYSLSVRKDTPYWQANYERPYAFADIETEIPATNHLLSLKSARLSGATAQSLGPMTWIATGMNYYIPDDIALNKGQFINRMNYKKDLQDAISYIDNRRKLWDNVSRDQRSLKDYLYETYYKAL